MSLFDRFASRAAAKGGVFLGIAGFLICAAPALGADSEPESTPTALHVGEVSVTATRAERDVLEVPGNVTVIDREQIDRSGVASIPDLLRRVRRLEKRLPDPEGEVAEPR